jgi:hypothetical protein
VWLLDVSWTCERLVASVADGYVVAQSAMQVFYYSFYSCHIVVVLMFLLLFFFVVVFGNSLGRLGVVCCEGEGRV